MTKRFRSAEELLEDMELNEYLDLERYTEHILKWMKRDTYTFISREGYVESKLGWIGIANYLNQITDKDDYGDVILVLKDKRAFRITIEKYMYPPELIEDRLDYYRKSFDRIYSEQGSLLNKTDDEIIILMNNIYSFKLLPITHKDMIGGEDKMENINTELGFVHCNCCEFGQLWGIGYKPEPDKEILAAVMLHTREGKTYSISITPRETAEDIDETLSFYRKALDDVFDQYGPLDMDDEKMVKFMENGYGITLTEQKLDSLKSYDAPKQKTGIILCHGFDEEADRNMIAMERPGESYVSTRYMLNGKYVLRKYEDIERLMDVADKLYIDSSTYKFEEQLLFDQMRRIIDIATKKNIPLMFSKYIEREHRFIVDLHFEEILKNVTGYRRYHIEQMYITPPQTNDNTKSCTIRIRYTKDLDNGYEKYVMTTKSQKLMTGSRIETEKDITKETYDILKNWKLPGSRIIKKTRTEISCSVSSCRVIVSVDRFLDPEVNELAGFSDKYGICEVETDVNIIPDSVLSSVPHITSWIHDAKEKDFLANITDIGCYSNKSLATLSPDEKIGYPNKPGAEVITLSEVTERMIKEGYRV